MIRIQNTNSKRQDISITNEDGTIHTGVVELSIVWTVDNPPIAVLKYHDGSVVRCAINNEKFSFDLLPM